MLNRRRILVNKRFQVKYTVFLVLLILFFLAFFSFDAYFSFKSLISQSQLSDIVRESLLHYLLVFWVKIFGFIVVVILLSIIFTHRIAGPVYRISKDITDMANESDLAKVFALRENDEFKELSWALNEFVNSLKTRLISDDNFREKVQFAIKYTLLELKKKILSDEEKNNVVALLDRLYKESCSSPVQFKL